MKPKSPSRPQALKKRAEKPAAKNDPGVLLPLTGSPTAEPLPDLKFWPDFQAPAAQWNNEQRNALHLVREIYEKVRVSNFDSGMNEFNGLYELLRYHPKFRLEAMAVARLWEAHAAMCSLGDRLEESNRSDDTSRFDL
jgi:hypothetical protein